MSPTPGSIHRRARADSGPARLWQWARTRRAPWTCADAAEACRISPRRCRAIVAALHEADLLDCVAERELIGGMGWTPSRWAMSAAGRALAEPPVMIVDAQAGAITGVRVSDGGDGAARLRAAVAASGLSIRVAAGRLGIADRTLRAIIAGDQAIAADDPVIARCGGL